MMKLLTGRSMVLCSLALGLVGSALLTSVGTLQAGEPPIKVACVGDSITYGAGVENREQNHYPKVLGELLGKGYEVRNFGVSGATAQKEGDHPYWKTNDFAKVSEFQPDIVVLMLGTNDSKPHNWESSERYAANVAALAEHFAELDSHPQVLLCLPPPAFRVNFKIRPEVMDAGVIPAVKSVAEKGKYPTIDVYAAFVGKSPLLPDGIHPNAAGAKIIAETVAPAVKSTQVPSKAATSG